MNELVFGSAVSACKMMRHRRVSAEEVVNAALDRIGEVNGQLNAVVQLAADRALAEARQADRSIARGDIKGPLHGLPITIKDSLDTAGIISTGGTKGRRSFVRHRMPRWWLVFDRRGPSFWARPTRQN